MSALLRATPLACTTPCLSLPLAHLLAPPPLALPAEDKPSEYIVIDDVTLDPVTLCAVSVEGKMLAPAKMSVKELRAELAARQCPLQGNKKELLKQLQKARLEAAVPGEAGPRTKKVAVVTVEAAAPLDDAEEEDDEEMMVRKVDDEDDEDEDDWEYDSMMYNVLRSKVNGLQFDHSFVSTSAGAKEALDLCDGAIECGAVPSVADIAIMATVRLRRRACDPASCASLTPSTIAGRRNHRRRRGARVARRSLDGRRRHHARLRRGRSQGAHSDGAGGGASHARRIESAAG